MLAADRQVVLMTPAFSRRNTRYENNPTGKSRGFLCALIMLNDEKNSQQPVLSSLQYGTFILPDHNVRKFR